MTPKERKAIVKAIRALDDWIVTHAPDFAGKQAVIESTVRIGDNGGTIAYATQVRTELEKLLK